MMDVKDVEIVAESIATSPDCQSLVKELILNGQRQKLELQELDQDKIRLDFLESIDWGGCCYGRTPEDRFVEFTSINRRAIDDMIWETEE